LLCIQTIVDKLERLDKLKSGMRTTIYVLPSSPLSGRSVLEKLRGRLVVSCQASTGDPLDHLETLTRVATAVLKGGAGGLRAEGIKYVSAFRAMSDLPIIGMIKGRDADGEVYITPTFVSAQAVSAAGADIIALDCTQRRLAEGEPWPRLIMRIHAELGRPVLADIATLEDSLAAEDAGADAVATTLYGYTAETSGRNTVPWPLIEALVNRLTVPVIVEGHITQPEELRRAFALGAHCVVVGSAITRPQYITARFVDAIAD
jgi:N-acylglucosamine-6-phosphate 2-epimerase